LGGTAAIAEMLLQSHDGEIHVLPALPQVWPAGQVRGLVARGGYVVDIEWSEGRADRLTIRTSMDGKVRVRTPKGTQWQPTKDSLHLRTIEDGLIELTCIAGQTTHLLRMEG
jgi:alpha-L-fucosidase 2